MELQELSETEMVAIDGGLAYSKKSKDQKEIN